MQDRVRGDVDEAKGRQPAKGQPITTLPLDELLTMTIKVISKTAATPIHVVIMAGHKQLASHAES